MASRPLRIVGIVFASIVGVIVLAVGTIYLLSAHHLNRLYRVIPPALSIPSDSATLERGRGLATARLGCSGCHGADFGGSVVIDAMPFGRFVAPNLTRGRGGIGGQFNDTDWVRAVRYGVRPDGRPLLFMPSNDFSNLGAEDLAAVIAWVKSVPPVDRQMPPSAVGPIGRMLMATGKITLLAAEQVDLEAGLPVPPSAGPTADYGRYIVSTAGCRDCHGPTLGGGKFAGGPDDPPARDITPSGIGQWSEADFIRALREGKRPDGTPINPFMPWKSLGLMSDDELRAIYAYLRTVPAA